jgi:hypothetical protein
MIKPLIQRGLGLPAKTMQRAVNHWQQTRWLDRAKMAEFHQQNLASMARIPTWIDAEAMRNSVFEYGVPDFIRPLIDLSMGQGSTYTDAMLALSGQLRKAVAYMEIGVSVGKNFFQMAESLRESSLMGFDIEEISPVLQSQYPLISKIEWSTAAGSLKKSRSSLGEFSQSGRGNRISYLSGDVFDEESWRHLQGRKFNLVFSDAFHSPEALLVEHEMLVRHGLLDDDELIMMWDDLGGGMTDAFQKVSRALRKSRRKGGSVSFVTLLKGWLGDNWEDHQVGFFISL